MPTIRSSWNDIKTGTKKTLLDRKVSPKLKNGVLQLFALTWSTLKKTFLAVFFAIFAQLKKILPLPGSK
jgi:hypothetical protein